MVKSVPLCTVRMNICKCAVDITCGYVPISYTIYMQICDGIFTTFLSQPVHGYSCYALFNFVIISRKLVFECEVIKKH